MSGIGSGRAREGRPSSLAMQYGTPWRRRVERLKLSHAAIHGAAAPRVAAHGPSKVLGTALDFCHGMARAEISCKVWTGIASHTRVRRRSHVDIVSRRSTARTCDTAAHTQRRWLKVVHTAAGRGRHVRVDDTAGFADAPRLVGQIEDVPVICFVRCGGPCSKSCRACTSVGGGPKHTGPIRKTPRSTVVQNDA